jgi:hypothetical protein
MAVSIARDQVHEPLFAVVPYFNPWRWKSRVKHTQRALRHFHDSGAVIVLVEVGLNRRDLVFADSGLDSMVANCGIHGEFKHKYIGLHSKDELWLKENAINIGVQSLPYDWQQVCWLDSDVLFIRPNWVGEAIHKLQQGTQSGKAFLQMFSHARDVSPNYELLDQNYKHANGLGFVRAWKDGALVSTMTPEVMADMKALGQDILIKKDISLSSKDYKKLATDLGFTYYAGRVFPGLAWGCTRSAWDAVGGLIDIAIWGGGDWHMAHALIEKTETMMRTDLHRNYQKIVNQWYQRCRTHIRHNVLVMEGTLLHFWHGKKIDRGYNAKHALLADMGFDPMRHLTKDSQGLWQLHDDRSTTYVKLRDMFRSIAHERNEDSIDV